MKLLLTGAALLFGVTMGFHVAGAATPAANHEAGCIQIVLNDKERKFCNGREAKQGHAPARRAVGGARQFAPGQPITVSASASIEVTADLVALQVHFREVGRDISEVIDVLKQRREKIVEIAQRNGLEIDEITIQQLDVSKRNRGQNSEYQGNAGFKISIASAKDPLELVARMSSLQANRVGQLKYYLSDAALAAANRKLEEMAKRNAREQAEILASRRGVELGVLTNFSLRRNNRHMRSKRRKLHMSGHGQAIFATK